MKKNLFISLFLFTAVLAFAEELTGFMGIEFGTTREEAAKIIEAKGYKLTRENDIFAEYLNPTGVYLGLPVRNIILSYSKDNLSNDNFFSRAAFEVCLDKDLNGDALAALNVFQKTFNLQQQRVEKLGAPLTTFYYSAPNKNRFIMQVTSDKVSLIFQHKDMKESQFRYIDIIGNFVLGMPKDIFLKEMQAEEWKTVDRSDVSYTFVKENGYFCEIWADKIRAEFDNEKLSVLSIIDKQGTSFIDDIIYLISDNIVTLKEKNYTYETVSYKFAANNNIMLTFTIPNIEDTDLWTITLSR